MRLSIYLPVCLWDGVDPNERPTGDVMTRYRLMGQGGQLVNCAISDEKLRVVFALFDADSKTEIAWYVFASNTDAATQRACTAKFPGAAFGDWGFRNSLGTFIPLVHKQDIPLSGLAEPWPKGSAAQLDLDLSGAGIQCNISQMKTTAKVKDIVAFAFTLQKTHQDPPIPRGQNRSKPSYKGKVYFLELATVADETAFKNALIDGPQANSSKILIDGPVM